MNTFEATYFDGHSAVSQQISIQLEENQNQLHLHFADGVSNYWQLSDLNFEKFDGLIEIRNRKKSAEILKCTEDDFINDFYKIMKKNHQIDIHTRLVNLNLTKVIGIAFGLIGFVTLIYFYVLPPIAEKSAALLPESFDTKIGDMFMETNLDSKEIEVKKTKSLEKFASKINLANTKPLRFTVVKSNEINAYAVPNGQIVVYSAILDRMKSYDQLVALLGHEASHVNHRHTTKLLCRNLAGYMIVSILLSDANGIMSVLADNARQIHSLSYSRSFEEEADEQGLEILIKNKVNPNGMPKLFEELEKENKVVISKFISTHPLTIERKKHILKIIAQSHFEIKPNIELETIFNEIKKH